MTTSDGVLNRRPTYRGEADREREGHDRRLGPVDLEQVRALLGHVRIETTQVYARIQPQQLKDALNFYESRALEVLSSRCCRVRTENLS